MTTEQIAELRRLECRPDRPHGTFDGTTFRLTMTAEQTRALDRLLASVPRLIDEREALLEALSAAAAALRFVHGDNTCAEQAARDAIAQAEAP